MQTTTQRRTSVPSINTELKKQLIPRNTTLMVKVNVMQINLQKSRAATNELVGQMINNNITMALVQEPYTCKATDVHKIPGLNGLKCMARSDDKFLSTIIYNGDNFSPLFIPQLSTKNIVVISAKIGITQVFVVSVYLPPSSELSTDLLTLQRILTETAGHKVFIGGDFNVRSTLWHDHRENSRAPTLEGFIINNDLEIINKPGTIPTFCSPKGSSYIDLTLTSQNAADDISGWTVSHDIAASDHNAINFTINTSRNNPAQQTMAPDFVIDCNHITPDDIAAEMQEWKAEFDRDFPTLNTPAQIDPAIESLNNDIKTRIISAKRRK
jgi:exonuclease III